MTPLSSGKYTNVFSHYRPVGDPQWFLKSNPSDTPLPILDLDEAFQRSEMKCSNEDSSSINQCNGDISTSDYEIRKENWIKQTMPYLSPKNEIIQNSDDLFTYWKKVNHINEEEEFLVEELNE